jgi:hypothetical protein
MGDEQSILRPPGQHLARFDWYVLRPIWGTFIVLGCVYCFQQEWLIGGGLIAMNLLVGLVAAGVHKGKTAAELAAGYPAKGDAFSGDPGEISQHDSFVVAKSAFKLGWIIALAAVMLSIHHGVRTYLAIPLGLAIACFGGPAIAIAFGLLLFLARKSR